MIRNKLKAIYALAMLMCFGSSLLVFVMAADEQSIVSGGQPDANTISLRSLIAQGPGTNRHLALSDFVFGKQYVFTTQLVRFDEVYVPMFPKGQAEDARNLHLLLWIRNDRNSNQAAIENQQQLDEFVAGMNRNPGSISGVLHSLPTTVRKLTAKAYPWTDTQSLQALWARNFPDQRSANLRWWPRPLSCWRCFGGTADRGNGNYGAFGRERRHGRRARRARARVGEFEGRSPSNNE
jgi:hypothetical protein